MTGFRSIRACDGHDPAVRHDVDGVVVVGSTCAGKTTLANAVRDSQLVRDGRVSVPARYITRPRRANDSIEENVHVSVADFESRVRNGEIALRWSRPMESGRKEHYGFEAVPAQSLPVYSANNAVYANPTSIWPAGTLDRALLVGVHAPDEVRAQRLRERSPDLFDNCRAEVAYRLGDQSKNVLPHVAVVIDNHGELEEAAIAEIVQLVERIADVFAGRCRGPVRIHS